MFTGIVEEMGRVVALGVAGESATLQVEAHLVAEDARVGASIAVNGVCLTITDVAANVLSFDVMPQTLSLTTLGSLKPGDPVNLERALAATGRFDGHVVQGHVDGVATLLSREPGPRWDSLEFALPEHLARYVAPQGSIGVAGVSLTVTHVGSDPQHGATFGVALIPTTLEVTTLGALTPGDTVNIEVDVLAKYVERALTYRDAQRGRSDGRC